MRTDNKIRVINAFDMKTYSHDNLTKFQKWICKVFKIQPRCWYTQQFSLLLPLPYYQYGGAVGDIMVFADTTDQWVVMNVHSRRIDVMSKSREKPRTEGEFRGMEGIIINSSFKEVSVR